MQRVWAGLGSGVAMSCGACDAQEDGCKVSLTPNVHEALCPSCFGAWVAHAMATKLWRNSTGAIVSSFRRWCEARKKVAA